MDQSRRGPSQQYILQGSILDENIDIVLHRLRAVCDDNEESVTKFKDREIVYTQKEGPGNAVSVSVRVKIPTLNAEQPHTLKYIGNPEIGDKTSPSTVRTYVVVNCTQNICSFLQELGFQQDYEYVSQGWLFRKNRLRATVSKIFKIVNPPNLDRLAPVTKSHLIEVSTVANSSNEQAANEVSVFADQLKPLVNLEKIDSRRLVK